MKSINITLPNEQFLFINELLKFGKYKNESEIISDALNIMERMHFDKKEELKRRYEEILKISENLLPC
ncbi:MAG TPA: hypothetical protein EYP22_04755 [Methanosarcinales archaeon]|nr:hypothetical protein [Methanosarcinales archaeon]